MQQVSFKDRLSALFAPVDMTTGEPVHQILRFAVPMLIGNIAQQMYNTVDSIVVGRYVGDNALAAVGSAMPILNLMFVLFIGISTGASIMVAQYFGARQREQLSKSICNCITLTAIASLIIMIIGPLLARPLLQLLNTPESIIGWCASYLTIFFLGFAGTGYYNILSGVLRGLGDAMSALLYLIVATMLNIVLDLVFVAYVGLGVPGVALATIIAQFISAILVFRRLMQRKDIFEIRRDYLIPDRYYAGKLIRLGLPSGATQAIFSMSMVVVQSLTNSFGEMFIAANVIVMRIDGFVVLPAFTFGASMTTFTGQNIGAGRLDRVIEGTRKGVIAAMGVSAVLSFLIFLFGRQLMGIFTTTQDLVNLSYSVMRILLVGYVVLEITQCLNGVMTGAGDTVTPMWLSIINTVCIRVPLAYLLVWLTKTPEQPKGNFYMLSTSLLITWIVGACLAIIAFRRGKWKEKAIIE